MASPISILILPGLLNSSEEPWLSDQTLPILNELSANSEVFGLNWLGTEVELVGLEPSFQMNQGPLTVAGLGADPPSRSVHFHISTLSVAGDRGGLPPYEIPEELDAPLKTALERLNTKSLIAVPGRGQDHGLVWENGSIDLETVPASDLIAGSLVSALPQGDGEFKLRRFIDDSINLLGDQEFNLIRQEEGLPPLNMFWPWGQGFRRDLPNLALRRGAVASFWSNSLRLAAVSRLSGYQHADRLTFGRGTSVRLEQLFKWFRADEISVATIGEFATWRESGSHEEYEWLLKEVEARLEPYLAGTRRLAVLAPGSPGLGFVYDPERRVNGRYPFDERTLEEPVIHNQLFELMGDLLS